MDYGPRLLPGSSDPVQRYLAGFWAASVALFSSNCLAEWQHLVARVGCVVPAFDLNPFSFQVLVNREEVGDFF